MSYRYEKRLSFEAFSSVSRKSDANIANYFLCGKYPHLGSIMASQNTGKLDAKVFGMSGKNIMTKKSSGRQLDIDLSAFGRGIYILTVTDSNGKTTSVKLMVK